jgi:hypothetical protein
MGGEVTKKKLIEACEEYSGKAYGQIRRGSVLWLVDPDNGNRVASIPNHDNGKTLPKPVAFDVLKGFTRGDDQAYRQVKSLLK